MKRFWHGFRRKPVEHEKWYRRWLSFDFSPELAATIANVFLKIVGETIRDRVLRAVLTALIAGLFAWWSPSSLLSLSAESQQQSTTEARH
jgi:hypothetical protein